MRLNKQLRALLVARMLTGKPLHFRGTHTDDSLNGGRVVNILPNGFELHYADEPATRKWRWRRVRSRASEPDSWAICGFTGYWWTQDGGIK